MKSRGFAAAVVVASLLGCAGGEDSNVPFPGDAGDDTAEAADTTVDDSASGDTGAESDSGTTDIGTTDVEASDTTITDSGAADTGVADSGAADTGVADTGPKDTGVADTGPKDTGVADTGFKSTDHVHIYIDNFCKVSVSPTSFTVPAGETLQLSYHNHSVDYRADVWMMYGGGYLGLEKGATWNEKYVHCFGPSPSVGYADINIEGGPVSSCPGVRLPITCK